MGERYVVGLRDAGEARTAVLGGKGAQLAALSRIEGTRVPDGFCVTTDAYLRAVARAPSLGGLLDLLAETEPDDREAVRALSARIRGVVEGIAVPGDIAAAVTEALAGLGAGTACAVRSSATAEDLPTASFAGQQDTYLNVVGAAEVLRHIGRCWASLFTERAVAYRAHHGIDHRAVLMAVVVQRMAEPRASGVLFTADPVTGNRRTAVVEAVHGLGEALVSGLVDPDVLTVRGGGVVARSVAVKERAVRAVQGGAVRAAAVEAELRERPALTDAEAVRLVDLGRRIEARLGCPQDIEWCLADDGFLIVQSRPITTLFPVPVPVPGSGPGPGPGAADGGNRVYVSVGHAQMMTDPMKALGLSLWQLTAMVPMHAAGGRLFVDVTARLAAPAGRAALLDVMGRGDPLVRDALETVLDREGFVPQAPDAAPGGAHAQEAAKTEAAEPDAADTEAPDPAVVAELVGRGEASLAALEREIAGVSGPALFDFLLGAFAEHRRLLGDPLAHRALMAGMDATWWLNDRLHAWLGEKNAADTLMLSAPGNVTAEMGLALLDVADAVRPHPEVVAYLERAGDDGFLDGLAGLPGGAGVRAAFDAYLGRYGMRCAGEIDITRPRWRERPAALVPALLDNVRNFGPGEAARRFEDGRRRARQKEEDVLARLRALPEGEEKAARTRRMIDRVRAFTGYREYPKYAIVSRSFVYRRALLAEARRLVGAGVVRDAEDVFHLTFEEFRDAVRTRRVDGALIARRAAEFRAWQALTPPRVLTSEGDALHGAYRRDDVPAGALPGVPVSAGTVEGRARVVADPARAELAAGDILVTAFTDPSWSPLFVGVAGLVTEVGGRMTHGAVIAREYGLPAVVGVAGATRLIRDGQRVRVHGTDGYVEVLS
ncbi:rifamycin-inactivating phosphotransferase [Streptomyces sp. NPDC047002]|uniref:rifamycin-inactivating phosphotransferase n=1 Tax=Streptomyces sp. NPDC047002 TaxID=3155475 RepID=UPI003455C283